MNFKNHEYKHARNNIIGRTLGDFGLAGNIKNRVARFKRNIAGPQYEWQVSKGQYPVSKFQPWSKGRAEKNHMQTAEKVKSAEYMANVENKADATGRKVPNLRNRNPLGFNPIVPFHGKFIGNKKRKK